MLRFIEMQGRLANDNKQSDAWDTNQGCEVSSPNSLTFYFFRLFYRILSCFTKFIVMYLILGEVSLVVGGVFGGLKR